MVIACRMTCCARRLFFRKFRIVRILSLLLCGKLADRVRASAA
jgi:hypothetical protein